ncbi:hypothetical protein [Streptosporangium sp. NPDC049046]|uniref:hypothetical protein n=1 Tax=Streptosporangium sp. NPDC049046 TaxID=3155031 RepID=UPI00343A0CA7
MRRALSPPVLTAAASPRRGLPTPGGTAVPLLAVQATATPAIDAGVPAALIGAAVARLEDSGRRPRATAEHRRPGATSR